MKYAKARMFNREAASPKNKADKILEILALQPGQTIADIGSGGGYFALHFAQAVRREGCVFAVDTNPGFLEFIKKQAGDKGLENIQTMLIRNGTIALPEHGLDFIFMRNVFHHLPNRIEYLRKLKSALKPQGKFIVIEHKRTRLSFHGLFGHFVAPEDIIEEMQRAGYRVNQKLDFLPKQSLTIFAP